MQDLNPLQTPPNESYSRKSPDVFRYSNKQKGLHNRYGLRNRQGRLVETEDNMLYRIESAAIKIQYHTRKRLMASNFYRTITDVDNPSQSEAVDSIISKQSEVEILNQGRPSISNVSLKINSQDKQQSFELQ